ncbi:hypothetical protein LCGC14_1833870 [marine sediment metagenome]|uniref:Uncharacterized protein n=1 Tax=marine sediment metagenome TaxID=412755 RepID=A0A0F9GF69_9ZZZZ
MSKGVRGRLSKRDVALFKLVLWCVLIVWAAFFVIYSTAIARIAKAQAVTWWGGSWGSFLEWTLPIFIVFTALLIVYGILRWAKRKLRPSWKLELRDAEAEGEESK